MKSEVLRALIRDRMTFRYSPEDVDTCLKLYDEADFPRTDEDVPKSKIIDKQLGKYYYIIMYFVTDTSLKKDDGSIINKFISEKLKSPQMVKMQTLIVINAPPTTDSISLFNALTSAFNVEIIQSMDLNMEIPKHKLQPIRVSIVPEDKELMILKRYIGQNATIDSKKQLPSTKMSDPLTRWFKFKHGEIIEYIRKDGSPYYRVVN